jgi:FKBP-type peptidyl-prolyl cis-trans isomerase
MMKQNLILAGAVIVLAAQLGCQKKPNLTGDGAKVSYAIGQGVGQNLKNQGVALDADVVGYAVTQTLKGEKPDIPAEELKKAVEGLQKAMRETASQEAEKNKSTASEFLAQNKAKEGVKTTASGLQYNVIKEGKGKKPTLNDIVTVHYTGTLADGRKFDSSRDTGKPAEFPLKAIIKGWQEALQLMPEGSQYRLVIPPDLGYGPAGKPPVIPPNSVLIFDVELIKVTKGK